MYRFKLKNLIFKLIFIKSYRFYLFYRLNKSFLVKMVLIFYDLLEI